jgi:hypothetical protein
VTANTQPCNNSPQFYTRLLIRVPPKSRLRRQLPKHQQFLPASSHCRYLSLRHFQGCHYHQILHHHPCLHHFQGCQLSSVPRHLHSAPPSSKNPSKTRRLNPRLLVQPLSQYQTPASRKKTTASKLPGTLSITSVPCLPNPNVSANAHNRAHQPFLHACPCLLDRQGCC